MKTFVLAVTNTEKYPKALGKSRVKFTILVLNLKYFFYTTAFNNINIYYFFSTGYCVIQCTG